MNQTLGRLSLLLLQPVSLFGQGTLTPPGAPAPTMKSLDQIEARTPLAGSTSTVAINNPGAYYLTGNITVSSSNGIIISADNVSLDLNGFTISSTASPAAGSGVQVNGAHTNITILNGIISSGITDSGGSFTGNGFSIGINRSSPGSTGILVRNVTVTGVLTYGIYVGGAPGVANSSVVEFCTVRTAGASGITADTVSNSSVSDCYNNAIIALNVENSTVDCFYSGISAKTVNGCYASSKNSTAIQGSVATNCYASGVGGISVSSATNCYATSTTLAAIDATVATGCTGTSSSGTGVSASQSATNCYGTTTSGTYGLYTQVANNCSGSYNGAANTSYGLYASALAIGCYGYVGSGSTSTGLYSFIANSCHGVNNGGANVSISTSHNINSF